jgi:hypothetical protein
MPLSNSRKIIEDLYVALAFGFRPRQLLSSFQHFVTFQLPSSGLMCFWGVLATETPENPQYFTRSGPASRSNSRSSRRGNVRAKILAWTYSEMFHTATRRFYSCGWYVTFKGLNPLKPNWYKLYLKIQLLLHRKSTAFPPYRPTD